MPASHQASQRRGQRSVHRLLAVVLVGADLGERLAHQLVLSVAGSSVAGPVPKRAIVSGRGGFVVYFQAVLSLPSTGRPRDGGVGVRDSRTTGCARHVGRVGALAVAMGIGTAIAVPGTAGGPIPAPSVPRPARRMSSRPTVRQRMPRQPGHPRPTSASAAPEPPEAPARPQRRPPPIARRCGQRHRRRNPRTAITARRTARTARKHPRRRKPPSRPHRPPCGLRRPNRLPHLPRWSPPPP